MLSHWPSSPRFPTAKASNDQVRRLQPLSTGTTADVDFYTSKRLRHRTDPRRSHVNWAVLDSNWEGEFCRVDLEGDVETVIRNHFDHLVRVAEDDPQAIAAEDFIRLPTDPDAWVPPRKRPREIRG